MEDKILNVNTTVDQNDGSSFQGLSLRDAILIANADPDNHYTINLPAGTYNLTIKNVLLPTTDSSADAATLFQSRLATGDLDIIGNVTIIGADPNTTIIDAETLTQPLPPDQGQNPFPNNPSFLEPTIGDRIFDVLSAERSRSRVNGNLTLENVTIKNGVITEDNIDATFEGGTTNGGAVNVEAGAKAIFRNTIITNSSSSGSGGAINSDGELTLERTTVSNNSSGGQGGAIIASGVSKITKSIIDSNNSADNAGGIYNTGTMTILDSAIIRNLADAAAPDVIEGGGGGILNEAGATLIMVNTTVAENRSASDDGNDPPTGEGDGGGGVLSRGTTRIINSTIANNAAQVGSGIYSETTTANTILYNTIVANNTGSPDLDGFFDPRSGFNLVSNANGSILDVNNGNIVGGDTTGRINVGLGNLTYNQDIPNPTFYYPIDETSLAYNAGDSEQVDILFYFPDDPPRDQRGSFRISGGAIDIGAFEKYIQPSQSQATQTENDSNTVEDSAVGIDSNTTTTTNTNNTNNTQPVLDNTGTTTTNIPDNTTNTTTGVNSTNTTSNNTNTQEFLNSDTVDSLLDDPLFRFQNGDRPGTYLFAGEAESQIIRRDFVPPFMEEGMAFNVSLEEQDGLMRINRFQSKISPGTYLFASETESINIRGKHSDTFIEEGVAFYAYGADANMGEDVFRYQSKTNPGTYLFVLAEEKSVIDSQFASQFIYEGVAFEVTT